MISLKTGLKSALALALATTLGASVTQAQTAPQLTFRYTTGAPAKTPWVTQLERFAATG